MRLPGMFFENLSALGRIAVMAPFAYVALIVLLRIVGKRSLSKLNAFDFVVTIALGSILATIILNKQTALLEGVLALALLAGLQWTVSRGSVGSSRFAGLIRSEPRLLLEDGLYRRDAMEAERVTTAEIRAAIRGAGIGSVEDVAAVILESDGSLNVIAGDGGNRSALLDVKR